MHSCIHSAIDTQSFDTGHHMNLKKLAIVLVVLLGGMAIYYNLSVSNQTSGDTAPKAEQVK